MNRCLFWVVLAALLALFSAGSAAATAQFTLTLNKAGAARGTVTSSPAGINCGEYTQSCSALFDAGTVVTLTAIPGNDSVPVVWSGACTADPCNVTMVTDQTVTATFNLIPFPAPQPGYTACAWEHDQCAFTGTKQVIYGGPTCDGCNTVLFTTPRQFTGGVLCDNSVFGDPLPGLTKHCEFQNVSTVHDVFAGQNLKAVIDGSQSGDTVIVHAGTYPLMTLSDQFTSTVTVKAAAGDAVTLQGVNLSNAAFLDFSGFTIDSGSVSVEDVKLTGTSHDITIEHNTIHGGRFGVYVIRTVGAPWSYNVNVLSNEISAADVDNIQVVGVKNMVVADNFDHDPHVNGNHNDGIQVIAADGMVIQRNHFTFTGFNNTGGPNQGIILGRADPYDATLYVNNVTVAANLIDHWEGTPLTFAGTSNVKAVNNTAIDSGVNMSGWGINITAKNNPSQFNNTGLELWNNITNQMVFNSGASPATYCGYNLTFPGSNPCSLGALTSDPQFVDHINYVLKTTSPALNSGITRTGSPATDVSGQAYLNPPSRGAHTN